MSGKFSALFCRYLTNLFHVALVSYQDLADARVRKTFDLMHPLTHIVEGVTIGHVIHNYDSVGTSVIAACQCAEAFLARSVPYLKLHSLIVE